MQEDELILVYLDTIQEYLQKMLCYTLQGMQLHLLTRRRISKSPSHLDIDYLQKHSKAYSHQGSACLKNTTNSGIDLLIQPFNARQTQHSCRKTYLKMKHAHMHISFSYTKRQSIDLGLQ